MLHHRQAINRPLQGGIFNKCRRFRGGMRRIGGHADEGLAPRVAHLFRPSAMRSSRASQRDKYAVSAQVEML